MLYTWDIGQMVIRSFDMQPWLCTERVKVLYLCCDAFGARRTCIPTKPAHRREGKGAKEHKSET